MKKYIRQFLSPHATGYRVQRRKWMALAVALLITLCFVYDTRAAEIHVTTITQGVNDDDLCSLQEAIFSANFDTNWAISPIATDLTSFIVTGCIPGDGDDTIVLDEPGVYEMSGIVRDPLNFLGPAANPLIFTNIIIEAGGATLKHVGGTNMRLFGIGHLDTDITVNGVTIPANIRGNLRINNAYIIGFTVKGGDGAHGGGGGMGAGGAIYVRAGTLTVESCTFEGNGANGGNGGVGHSGGGGGLAGDGGFHSDRVTFYDGGGGGGSRGNGAAGGGGGGTLSNGTDPNGGFRCGGDSHDTTQVPGGEDGDDGYCFGGGGGGGESRGNFPASLLSGDGGDGDYGGGGGGGGYPEGDGGDGGFIGGGGGAGGFGEFGDAGDGGFGGGGGANGTSGDLGEGGTFAGDGSGNGGGGGAALGGAIFNDLGTVMILNSTFTANFVAHGLAGGDADNGQDAGGAIFSVDGSLTVINTTISGNEATGTGGGIAFYSSTRDTPGSFTVRNTIIASNGVRECFYTGDLDQLTTAGSGNMIIQNFGCPGNLSTVTETTDPKLGTLQVNSPGMTPTMAIGIDSPALNAGDDDNCREFDQRGITRATYAPCDIGAYELDNLPPVAQCKDVTASAGSNCTAEVNIDNGSYDPDTGDTLTYAQSPASPYGLGTRTVTLTVTDDDGASSSCTGTVTVVDDVPPVISNSLATTVFSSSRKHDLVNVGLSASATDCSTAPTTFQVQVFGDEDDQTPTSNTGTVFSPDAKDLEVGTLRLRAERADSGDGRVYLIVVRGSDGSGNTGFACSTVVIPHNSSAADLASVNTQAGTAKADCEANNGAKPSGFFVIGDGPVIGPKQ